MAPVRFRKLYEALGLRVVGHKDGTLEVSWGGGRCAGLPARGPQTGTTTSVAFRALLRPAEQAEAEVLTA